jgi:hypothetical protein
LGWIIVANAVERLVEISIREWNTNGLSLLTWNINLVSKLLENDWIANQFQTTNNLWSVFDRKIDKDVRKTRE